MNEQLVIMEGIDARPELNGELGIATNFNEGNGRYDVRIISLDKSATKSLSVILKSGNLAGHNYTGHNYIGDSQVWQSRRMGDFRDDCQT